MSIHIEIKHTIDAERIGEIAHVYDCDTGPLAMPAHIKLFGKGSNVGGGHDNIIRSYADQVDEYNIWLEDQLKAQNTSVMIALDKIFTMAQGHGVVLATRCCPCPYITHAHIVKNVITELAAGVLGDEQNPAQSNGVES